MLAPRRTSLDRLPLLMVMALATLLVVRAMVGAPRKNIVLAGVEEVHPATAPETAPLVMRPSDVPGVANEPSELLNELLSLSMGSPGSTRRPMAAEARDPDRRHVPRIEVGAPAAPTSAGAGPFGDGRSRGELKDGLPEGRWVVFHPNGEPLAEGNFESGLPQGPWTWWDEDGSVHLEGEFSVGLATGEWRGWHMDGTLSLETAYENGEQEGTRTEWTREGRVSLQGLHKGGLRNGLWITYYEDGTARSKGHYENGLRDGRWNQWHPDGSAMMQGSYRRGRRDGDWTEWFSNNQLKEGGDFVDGRREGWWEFYLFDGTPDRRTGTYTNGRRQRN